MDKIKTIDRQAIKSLREPIEAALEALGTKMGISFQAGNGTYGEETGHFKLLMTVVGADGTAKETMAIDFERDAVMLGLKASDLGKTFSVYGKNYVIVGCKPRSYKRPIIGQKVGGTGRYKFSAKDVKVGLKKS